MPATEDAVQRAVSFVEDAYRRADKPEHCAGHSVEVGRLLSQLGCSRDVVVAGVLHDVVEDTCASREEVRARFGARPADLISALTENPDIEDYRRRKSALRQAVLGAGRPALLIFAADKLARVRAADRDAEPIAADTLEHYRRTLELLVASGVRTAHVDELARRLAAQRRRPPAQPRADQAQRRSPTAVRPRDDGVGRFTAG